MFAFSQLVALILHDATWHGIGEAGLLLLLLWLPSSRFHVVGQRRAGQFTTGPGAVPAGRGHERADGRVDHHGARRNGGLLFALPLASIFLVALTMMVLSLDSDSNVRRSALRYGAPSSARWVSSCSGTFSTATPES